MRDEFRRSLSRQLLDSAPIPAAKPRRSRGWAWISAVGLAMAIVPVLIVGAGMGQGIPLALYRPGPLVTVATGISDFRSHGESLAERPMMLPSANAAATQSQNSDWIAWHGSEYVVLQRSPGATGPTVARIGSVRLARVPRSRSTERLIAIYPKVPPRLAVRVYPTTLSYQRHDYTVDPSENPPRLDGLLAQRHSLMLYRLAGISPHRAIGLLDGTAPPVIATRISNP